MKPYYLLISIIVLISLWSCMSGSGNRNGHNTGANQNSADNGDSIIKIETAESIKKFAINDSMAIALVQQVPEIKQIIDYKYADTTIFNELHLVSVPTDSDNKWQFQVVQFQKKIDHAASLIWLLVNARTGEIGILDIPKDTVISLDDWRRIRRMKDSNHKVN